MIAHGISSPMCFFLSASFTIGRTPRDQPLRRAVADMPKYARWQRLLLRVIGAAGLCGFIGEVYVLIGTFQARDLFAWAVPMAIVAAAGVILTAGYILWLVQRCTSSEKPEIQRVPGGDRSRDVRPGAAGNAGDLLGCCQSNAV